MKVIPISKKKYEELTRLRLPKDVVSTEAIIYRFDYHGEDKVFKNLLKLSGVTFANKQFTLSMLDEYRDILPESFVLPDCLCTIQGKVSGFTMPYVAGVNLESYLNNKNVSNQDKLFYIAKIGEVLEQLDHIRNNSVLDSIYINDLHASNFIVDPKVKNLTNAFYKLILGADNDNFFPYVESLTDEQVCRANYKVYKNVKK